MFPTKSAIVTKATIFETKSPKRRQVTVDGRQFHSLSYRHEGAVSITVGGKTAISAGGSITYVPKGLKYSTEVLEDTRMTVIHFDLSGDILPDTITVTSSPETAVTALFARLSSGLAEGEPTLEQMSVFYALLARLSMPQSDKKSRTPDKINEAKRLFDEQFPDPYLSISDIAARLGISTAYLRREFSACFGTSPINYLKSARLSKAKAMLLFESLSIDEVALACGFSGAGYFIREFRRYTAETPGSYRRRLLSSP